MNNKTARILRAFSKENNLPFRQLKRTYSRLSSSKKFIFKKEIFENRAKNEKK